ncbi:putative actin-fragmin kinase DDB_G0287957 [Gordionus sp. m RMFG-2023]|uniref:putative actin-fragmin kinase DDB_G0287957 n=1 Tax=Gordionus sp. m RMFG-2023 TaxID=3053472 RepID=UPI0031FC9983
MSAIIPEVLFEGDILSLDKLNMLSVVNMNRILEQDILNCKEIDKFKLIMKWAESDKKRLEYLPQLLRYITFERMDSDEIMNCFIKMKPMENLRFLVSKFMRQGSSSKKSSLNDGKGNYSDTVFEQFDEHSKEKAALSKGFVNDELRERPVKIYKGVFDESKGEFVTNTSNKKGSGENSEVENNSSGTMSKEWIPSEKSVKAVNNSPNISSSESNQDTHQPQKDLSCPKLGNLQSSSENIASSISIPSVPSQAEVPSESEDTNISVNNSLSPNTDSSSSHLIKKDVSLEDKIMDGDNSVPQNLIGDNSVTQKLGSDSQVVQNLGGDNSVSLGPIVTAQPDEKNFLPNFENNKNVALIISESQERVTNYKIYDNAKNFYGNETKYREISNENFRSPPVLVNQTPMKGADSETLIGIPVYLRNSHLARDYQMIMKFETNEMKKDGGFTEKLNQPGTKPFFEDGKLILELTNDNQILQKEHKMIHTPPINPHAHHHPDHNCAHHSTFVNNSCRDNNALNYNHCVPKPHSNNNNVAMSSSQNMNVTGGRIPMIYNMTSMPNSIYNNNSFAPMMVSANRQIFDPQKYTGSVFNNLPLNTSVLNNQPLSTFTLNNQSLNTSVLSNQPLNTSVLNNHPLNTFTLNNQSLNTSVLSNQPLNTSVFNNQRLITSVLNNQPLKYF